MLNAGYDWVFLVDTDEYLLLAPQFESIQAYIRAKEAKYGVLDAIQFRWAMSDQLMPGCQEVFLPDFFAGSVASKAVFQTPQLKTMHRVAACPRPVNWGSHFPLMSNRSRIYLEGYFPWEANRSKASISENAYQETILFHLITRSLSNMVTKSLISEVPRSSDKRAKDPVALRNFLSGMTGRELVTYRTMVAHVGRRARSPLIRLGCCGRRILDNDVCKEDNCGAKYILLDSKATSRRYINVALCNATEDELATKEVLRGMKIPISKAYDV